MLVMETRVKIRLRYYVKKHTISQISRELKLSRNTVKRIIREEDTRDIALPLIVRTHYCISKAHRRGGYDSCCI